MKKCLNKNAKIGYFWPKMFQGQKYLISHLRSGNAVNSLAYIKQLLRLRCYGWRRAIFGSWETTKGRKSAKIQTLMMQTRHFVTWSSSIMNFCNSFSRFSVKRGFVDILWFRENIYVLILDFCLRFWLFCYCFGFVQESGFLFSFLHRKSFIDESSEKNIRHRPSETRKW